MFFHDLLVLSDYRVTYLYTCVKLFLFFRGQGFGQELFRLGLSMGFSELKFLGQIASFERRLRGVALQRPSP